VIANAQVGVDAKQVELFHVGYNMFNGSMTLTKVVQYAPEGVDADPVDLLVSPKRILYSATEARSTDDKQQFIGRGYDDQPNVVYGPGHKLDSMMREFDYDVVELGSRQEAWLVRAFSVPANHPSTLEEAVARGLEHLELRPSPHAVLMHVKAQEPIDFANENVAAGLWTPKEKQAFLKAFNKQNISKKRCQLRNQADYAATMEQAMKFVHDDLAAPAPKAAAAGGGSGDVEPDVNGLYYFNSTTHFSEEYARRLTVLPKPNGDPYPPETVSKYAAVLKALLTTDSQAPAKCVQFPDELPAYPNEHTWHDAGGTMAMRVDPGNDNRQTLSAFRLIRKVFKLDEGGVGRPCADIFRIRRATAVAANAQNASLAEADRV
jgi:hypothetical protein